VIRDASATVSAATRASEGTLSHCVSSDYQAGETKIHVILPEGDKDRYGMGEVFATQENMDRYCVVDLVEQSVEALAKEPRLALYGYSEFRGHHQFLHYHMLKRGIPHEYSDGPRRSHRWDSGWLPDAVEFLAR
jgi:hypothetical protein